jgi:hypothetical protein
MALQGKEHAFATKKHLGAMRYEGLCRLLRLPPTESGYGLIMVLDDDGKRWTVVTDDMTYFEMLVEGNTSSVGLPAIPPEKFPVKREGWPDDW